MLQTETVNNKTTLFVSDSGGYFTECHPEKFHNFYTRKILAPGERPEDFVEVTAAEKAKLEEADAAYTEPPQAFIDLWNSRCNFGGDLIVGKYDPENAPDIHHSFMANELWFTYKEAIDVLTASNVKYSGNIVSFAHTYPRVKTFLPTMVFGGTQNNYSYCTQLVNLRLMDGYQNTIKDAIGADKLDFSTGLNNLERLLTPFAPYSNSSKFTGCPKLHELKFKFSHSGCTAMDIRYLPLWSLESAQYSVRNKTSSVDVVLTVHPDVFAKLTGDTSNAAAATLSEEELQQWMALPDLAAEKKLIFVTT